MFFGQEYQFKMTAGIGWPTEDRLIYITGHTKRAKDLIQYTYCQTVANV